MIKLHIGCGKRDFGPEWYHIDGGVFSHLHSHDIFLKGFTDNSADLIYASHLLEYFDRQEAVELLREWHRVLKSGGILRIAVPDWDAIWCQAEIETPLDKLLGLLYGKMEMNGNKIYHKTVYDFTSLERVLKEAKFTEVYEYNWQETDHAQFDDHSQAYLPHMDKENGRLMSLNVEAIK